MPDHMIERAALVALLQRAQTPAHQVIAQVARAGSAWAALDAAVAHRDTLFPEPNRTQELLDAAAQKIEAWEQAGLGVHTIVDATYPARLRELRQPPPLLFSRGRLAQRTTEADADTDPEIGTQTDIDVPADDTRAIAIVGTRAATERGLHITHRIATGLADQGITVVSGLAAGIDTAAHQAALAAHARTVAVIGTGITCCYPQSNQALQERIPRAGGLVLSQFWPDAPPRPDQFTMRNAVLTGYGAATVVVEAGRTSGARNAAGQALLHGRPVILLAELLTQDWAQAMADRPGVHVVAGPDELFGIIDRILRATVEALRTP